MMPNFLVLLSIVLVYNTRFCIGSSSDPPLTSPLGPVISVGYAAFAGNATTPSGDPNGPIVFFGGIPYAQPPLGNLRFRAPQPLDERPVDPSKIQIMDARNFHAGCIQQPTALGVASEDCLTLNVWKPTNAKEGDKLPVVVYIHGGGFFAGSPQSAPLYDWVAKSATPIVGVNLAYRLNLLGFLSSAAVEADGDLNVALKDQRAALEWVQRHIHQFGGDPNNVTISGESAGGASVVMQVVAFGGTKPAPFKRAIAQSIGFGPMPTPAEFEAIFANVATIVGCPTSGPQTMPCLRQAPIAAIMNAINNSPHFWPVTDGPNGFLPDFPSQLIASGRFHNVDFIGGHCTNDGRTFVGGTPDQFVTDDDILRITFAMYPRVTNATFERALQLYPAPGTPNSQFVSQFDRAGTMAQDVVFSCMDWELANKLTTRGVENVFAFRWNSPNAISFAAQPFLGVMHASDLYFLFEGKGVSSGGATISHLNASEEVLATEAIEDWTSFGVSSIPTAQISPQLTWEKFNGPNGLQRLVFQRGSDTMTNSTMEPIPAIEIERCKFWMSRDVVVQTGV